MRTETDADVVVVGAGPVGTVALALLGQAGLTAIGIEKDAEPWPTARAVHFDGETFRTLQSLGIAARLEEVTIPMTSLRVENEARETLVRIPTGRLGDQGWHDDINFHQPEVETQLRELVEDTSGVELRVGTEALKVRPADDGVEVDVLDSAGVETTLRARWVIAADGARSPVRQAVGIKSDRFGEDQKWVVVDGHLIDSPGYEDDMVFLSHHSRPALWVRLPGTRVRMEFMVMPDDDLDEIITPAGVERMSLGVLPADRFTAERQAIYTFRGRVARQWRSGPVFLAGDAAHQAPPLFGQGLCAGIRDVVNLIWKFELVANGSAGDEVLDTYESERAPHARFWVEQAVQAALGVQTTDPEIAARRDAAIRTDPTSLAPVSPRLGPGLHTGAVNTRAGGLSIQPVLADGCRLDDRLGSGFIVVATTQTYDALDTATRSRLERDDHIVVLRDAEPGARQLLEASEAIGLVIRPDRYIFGTASSPAELTELVNLIPGFSPHPGYTAIGTDL